MTIDEKEQVLARAKLALVWLLQDGGYKRQHADCLWELLGKTDNGVTFASLSIRSATLAATIAAHAEGDQAFLREFRAHWPNALKFGKPEHSATVTTLCG